MLRKEVLEVAFEQTLEENMEFGHRKRSQPVKCLGLLHVWCGLWEEQQEASAAGGRLQRSTPQDSLEATCRGNAAQTHLEWCHWVSCTLPPAAHGRSARRTHWNQGERPLPALVSLQCIYWKSWLLITLKYFL